jgi:serine/threonine-protein kinase
MSPEQVKNSKAVDARSDLWSVAVILFELLTGESPFPGDNEFARLTSVLSEEPMPISQAAPGLAHWTPFFQRALAKEPTQRFQSSDEMAQGLLAAARGRNSLQPPPPTLQAGDFRPSQASVPYAAILGMPVQQASGLIPAPSMRGVESSGIVPSPVMHPPAGSTLQSGPAQLPTYRPPQAYTPEPPYAGAAGGPGPRAPAEPSGVMQAPLSAMAAVSAPMSHPQGAQSVPPQSMGPLYTAAAQVGPTHVSAQRPAGTPTVQDAQPSIQIVEAPKPPGVAPWVVIVVGFVTFALGFGLGLILR